MHGDAVCGVFDQQHRRPEDDVVCDECGQALRDLAGAADEPGGLGAALGLRKELRRDPAGLNREQQMQEGHFRGRHREYPDGADLQQRAGDDRQPLGVVPGASVIPSHSVARGASQGASTGTSAANTSRRRSTSSSSLSSEANRAWNSFSRSTPEPQTSYDVSPSSYCG